MDLEGGHFGRDSVLQSYPKRALVPFGLKPIFSFKFMKSSPGQPFAGFSE